MRYLNFKKFPYNLVILSTIGDGSCMFHAILQGFNKTYIDGDTPERRNIVRKFRNNLSDLLGETMEDGKTCYEQLSRGELKDISKEVPEASLENMKKALKTNSWGDQRYLELISNQLDVDIFVINSYEKDVYFTGDYEIYYKNRDSVIILNTNNAHFETIGIKVNSETKTFFDKDNEIIKFLRTKMSLKNV